MKVKLKLTMAPMTVCTRSAILDKEVTETNTAHSLDVSSRLASRQSSSDVSCTHHLLAVIL